MEKLKSQRRTKRAQSTRVINLMNAALNSDTQDVSDLQDNLESLSELHKDIDDLDKQILEWMVENDVADEDQDKEAAEAFEYKKKFLAVKRRVDSLGKGQVPTPAASECEFNTGEPKRSNVRYPEVEWTKFSGDLKDWLGFWSQFEKIDKDDTVHGSDKFRYLLQHMTPGTDAYEMVNSYPHSAENYKKAVEALQRRYGDKDLLLQVYVRELLKLVITNATSKEKIPFQSLYLKLDSHLRALKTLQLEKADPATWLFPLVESSLPKEVLMTWQRSPQCSTDGSNKIPPVTRIDLMMDFLRTEVEIQQKILLAQTTFQDSHTSSKKDGSGNRSKQDGTFKVPTLAHFHVSEGAGCVFCERSHQSQDCITAQGKSVKEKISILKEKKRCFRCFRPGHQTRVCKFKVVCLVCGQRHYTLMCNSRDGWSSRPPQQGPVKRQNRPNKSQDPRNPTVDSNATSGINQMPLNTQQQKPPLMSSWSEEMDNLNDCSNFVCTDKIKLKTLMAYIGTNQKRLIPIFIDDGSQRSYVLSRTAQGVQFTVITDEKALHSLFGAVLTGVKEHRVYQVALTSMDGNYQCQFYVRESKKISNSIPRIKKNHDVIKELNRKNIRLTDVGEGTPEIELLIGADYCGRLLTNNIVQLSCGLTAVETKLGWVFTEEADSFFCETNMYLTSSHAEMSITDMWSLETLGIKEPAEVKSAAAVEEEAKQAFMISLMRENDGRYVASLPWKAPRVTQSCHLIMK